MVIKTNYEKLRELAGQLSRLEEDLADVTSRVTRVSKTTAQTVKYCNSERAVRRACDNAIEAANEVNRRVNRVCDRLHSQSRVIRNSVNSYKENDKIKRINSTSAVSRVGKNLGGIFDFAEYASYISQISVTIYKFL